MFASDQHAPIACLLGKTAELNSLQADDDANDRKLRPGPSAHARYLRIARRPNMASADEER